jgi:hypothetical protein
MQGRTNRQSRDPEAITNRGGWAGPCLRQLCGGRTQRLDDYGHRLVLSNAQERAVLRAVRKQNHQKQSILSGFEPEIGQPVPPSATLRRLPSEATSGVWAVRSYAYVLTPTQLLIVNPQDRIVDDIIGY